MNTPYSYVMLCTVILLNNTSIPVWPTCVLFWMIAWSQPNEGTWRGLLTLVIVWQPATQYWCCPPQHLDLHGDHLTRNPSHDDQDLLGARYMECNQTRKCISLYRKFINILFVDSPMIRHIHHECTIRVLIKKTKWGPSNDSRECISD